MTNVFRPLRVDAWWLILIKYPHTIARKSLVSMIGWLFSHMFSLSFVCGHRRAIVSYNCLSRFLLLLLLCLLTPHPPNTLLRIDCEYHSLALTLPVIPAWSCALIDQKRATENSSIELDGLWARVWVILSTRIVPGCGQCDKKPSGPLSLWWIYIPPTQVDECVN